MATRQNISLKGEKVVSFATGIKANQLRFIFGSLRLMQQNQATKNWPPVAISNS